MIIKLIMLPLLFYLAVMVIFVFVQRPVFILFNRQFENARLNLRYIWDIYRFGIKTDIIACAFLTVVPLLATIAQAFIPWIFLPVLVGVYCVLSGLFITLIIMGDTILYEHWRYKIDASVLPYLKSLKGAFASVTTNYLLIAILVLLVVWCLMSLWLWTAVSFGGVQNPFVVSDSKSVIMAVIVSVLMVGGNFILIRGLGRRPKNPALAFFSKILFFNHSALNPVHNFLYSLTINDKIDGVFHFFPKDECSREFSELFPVSEKPSVKLFSDKRPNILFIIWESLSARFVEVLGGEKDVTPNFNRLSKEGVLFTRVDASGTRTDRGIVALLSGYIAQPTLSVIRMTRKLPNLPALPKVFRNAGYTTTILHGGDLSIFHKKEYYLTVGHEYAVDDDDLPKASLRGKWGIHDGITMQWLLNDIKEKTLRNERWFITYQTLSSHEPWIVPYTRLLPDKPVENAFAYVDDEFGKLIDGLKKTEAWDNLLVIVTGDHGCNMCEPIERNKYTHIPVLLLGGAVREPMEIDTIISQTDLAATLLGQLDMPVSDFTFSRDVLAPSYTYPFSFHTFQNGFMFRDESGYTIVDTTTGKAIENPDAKRERNGKIILQSLYEDLAKR